MSTFLHIYIYIFSYDDGTSRCRTTRANGSLMTFNFPRKEEEHRR